MVKFNFYCGITASAWLLAILVIAAELSAPFKAILVSAFGHHWIGKAVLTALAFVAFGLAFSEKEEIFGISSEKLAFNSTIGGLAVIFLFYLVEYFA